MRFVIAADPRSGYRRRSQAVTNLQVVGARSPADLHGLGYLSTIQLWRAYRVAMRVPASLRAAASWWPQWGRWWSSSLSGLAGAWSVWCQRLFQGANGMSADDVLTFPWFS
jgi:hypothetical protein